MRNHRTVTVKMNRIDLVNLMMACTSIEFGADSEGTKEKWRNLHDMLKTQLDEFDAKLDAEEHK